MKSGWETWTITPIRFDLKLDKVQNLLATKKMKLTFSEVSKGVAHSRGVAEEVGALKSS